MGQTALDNGAKVALPRLLRLSTFFSLQYPLTTVFLIIIELAGSLVLFEKAHLLPLAANIGLVFTNGMCVLLLLRGAVKTWCSGIFGDLVDYVGESRAKECFAWANVEVRAAPLPSVVLSVLPLLAYFMALRDEMDDMEEEERGLIYATVAVMVVCGAVLGLIVVGGLAVLIRLLAAFLKVAVQKHFDNLEDALTCEGLSQEQRINLLDSHCKSVKRVFEKANRCVTKLIFSGVIFAYLSCIISVLQLVVSIRSKKHTPEMILCLGGVCALSVVTGTFLLHSLTSVADHHEDLASNFSFNINLRLQLTNLVPGPAGVKLLSSIENDYGNDLGFHFHHRPLDARVLEGTVIKLASGALVTVCLGILT